MANTGDNYGAPDVAKPVGSNALGMALGISGLVIGILALLFSFIPCIGVLAFWPGVAAAGLSAAGIFLSVRSKGLPIAALIISLISVGIAYYQGEQAKKVAEEVKKQGEELEKDLKERKKKESE